MPWQTALGMVFWAGVLFLAVSATPLRETIAMAIPPGLRLAAAAGIGLLLTLIGLRNAGLIEADTATLLRLGTFDHRAAFLLAGVLVAVMLQRRNNPLAYLTSIVLVTAGAWTMGYAMPPERIVSAPDFSSAFLKLDIGGALQLALLPAIVSILFTDLFDSLSTFIGVAGASGLTDPDGRPRNLKRGLIVDAFATLGAGLAGTSSGTAYVESIAGIRMGARTGRASVVTALCFLPCFFIGPLAAAVPGYATAAVLILVGFVHVSVGDDARFQVARGQPAGVHDDRPDSADAVDHAGHPVGIPAPRAALHRRRARKGGRAGPVGPGGALSGSVAHCKVRLKPDTTYGVFLRASRCV